MRIFKHVASVVSVVCICSQPVSAQLILTEVQPVPAAGEPEWVELWNTSSRDVSLEGWRICDPRSCAELPAVSLRAGTVCVLTRDEVALREQRALPNTVFVLTLALPSLNNTTDTLMLYDKTELIDSMAYAVRSRDRGRSIERSGVERSDVISWDVSWSVTTAADSATCGRINSAVRSGYDYRLRELRVLRERVAVVIVNDGTRAGGERRVACGYNDVWFDTVIGPLRVGEIVEWIVPAALTAESDRIDRRAMVARFEGADDRPENDTLAKYITGPPIAGTVMINEVLVQPRSGECDFVEIWNGLVDTLDLADWVIETTRGVQYRCIAPLVIPPSGLGVLCASMSSAFLQNVTHRARTSPTLALQQERELLVLCTPEGLRVDSMWYDRSYHHPRIGTLDGVSLEKRSERLRSEQPAAWTSCAALARSTPGAANSVGAFPTNDAELAAHPSIMSSDVLHPQFTTQITWQIPFVQSRARIDIYDEWGYLRQTLCNACFLAAAGSIVWDGHDADGRRVGPGPYVVSLFAVDASSNETIQARCLIVVAE